MVALMRSRWRPEYLAASPIVMIGGSVIDM
jgi:hypothetical protein